MPVYMLTMPQCTNFTEHMSFMISIIIAACQTMTSTANGVTTSKEIIHRIFNKDAYDKYTRPLIPHPKPHLVKPRIEIKDIFDVSERAASISVRYYFKLTWLDERFKFTPFKEENETVDAIQLPADFIKENGKP